MRRLQKRSAVAMILQVREGELHILMIKRAEREGDPWSGHMAFPGGRMDQDGRQRLCGSSARDSGRGGVGLWGHRTSVLAGFLT